MLIDKLLGGYVNQSFNNNCFLRLKLFGVVALLVLFMMPLANAQNVSESTEFKEKVIIGGLESVSILPYALQFNAKVDTGAKNSSMHATDIEIYAQGDQEFVRFKTLDSNSKSSMIDLPLLRKARIKRHGGESMTRAVVDIGICLGSVYKVVQVTLIDRSRFKFPFLIGASFLNENFIVDVAQKFTAKANCNSITSKQ